jgi:hypothetical protein
VDFVMYEVGSALCVYCFSEFGGNNLDRGIKNEMR